MKWVTLPTGEKVPALGLGTWHMGERKRDAAAEAKALVAGIDAGLTLIDTAEMYGEGGAEEVVREAVAGRRDEVFIVSKVYPHNASARGAVAACERSLKRLGTDRIDLYLLHWRGSYPLAETVGAFEGLKRAGKIRHWGVSNLDTADMTELWGKGNGTACAANQVLYHLGERGIEWDLLPALRSRKVPVMAYSPLGQGGILREPALGKVAAKHKATAAQIALAWVLRQPDVIAIPKSASVERTLENAKALEITLDADDLKMLDTAFPPPGRASPLAML